ncbi:MAG: ribose ABC transporter permease [Mesoaciditoga sp.]|uniref:ABC transporter permease n=1 Tax=Athalassotoga sp. TaxID=2022597 RepID=UPI000CB31E7B|nr:MAG: ribose ABC transporter permease [Mesoaciditoga sp.]HEU24240.1 ribose ABC transporter permease [Mesoaciditoga lauensis]
MTLSNGFIRRYGVIFGLAGIIIFFAIESPNYFFTPSNFILISKQSSINILLALGEMFVILTAGIDLSVGAIAGLVGAVAAGTIVATGNLFLGLIAGIGIGIAFGLINGVIVAFAKVPAFIATLATMSAITGITLIYTQGEPIWNLPSSFDFIGQGNLADIPFSIILMALAFVAAWIVLEKTKYGRHIYAVGGNIKASRAAGIKISAVLVSVYAISGLLSAIGGIVLASRLGTAEPTAGSGYELDAIAAVVLGGTSLFGGEGWVVGTIIGGYIIAVLNNGMTIMNISAYYQEVVKGLVILLAVMLTSFGKKYWNE